MYYTFIVEIDVMEEFKYVFDLITFEERSRYIFHNFKFTIMR